MPRRPHATSTLTLAVPALLLAGCASDAAPDVTADGSEPRVVEVTMLDAMAFDPAEIAVSEGETVVLVVTNAGEAVHELVIGDADQQAEHAEEMADMEGMDHDMGDEDGEVEVAPGETEELTWTFDEVGGLQYACHQPGHFEAGMVGTFTPAA